MAYLSQQVSKVPQDSLLFNPDLVLCLRDFLLLPFPLNVAVVVVCYNALGKAYCILKQSITVFCCVRTIEMYMTPISRGIVRDTCDTHLHWS